jgi:5-methyltetrahydrofolate--homocysteine methyltransferase
MTLELLRRVAESVVNGRTDIRSPYPPEFAGQEGCDELTRQALEAGIPPNDVLNLGLVAGMKTVGDRFRDGEIFLPEVLMAARALSAGFEHLKPLLRSGAIRTRGTIVVGTVAGDLHDIGKRIVSLFFEGGGWNVIDLGVDVPAARFAQAIEEHHPAAVGLSTLLTTTMSSMESIARELKSRFPEVKVVVGGAPITRNFAEQIGADAYSPDPQGALDFLEAERLKV